LAARDPTQQVEKYRRENCRSSLVTDGNAARGNQNKVGSGCHGARPCKRIRCVTSAHQQGGSGCRLNIPAARGGQWSRLQLQRVLARIDGARMNTTTNDAATTGV